MYYLFINEYITYSHMNYLITVLYLSGKKKSENENKKGEKADKTKGNKGGNNLDKHFKI